jgi:hypothetical protein
VAPLGPDEELPQNAFVKIALLDAIRSRLGVGFVIDKVPLYAPTALME